MEERSLGRPLGRDWCGCIVNEGFIRGSLCGCVIPYIQCQYEKMCVHVSVLSHISGASMK